MILLVVAWWIRPPSMDDPVTTTGRVSANEGARKKKTPIISFEAGERTYTFDPSFSTYPPIPVGTEVEVRYERNDPSVAQYVRWETERAWLISLAFGLVLVVGGAAAWIWPAATSRRN